MWSPADHRVESDESLVSQHGGILPLIALQSTPLNFEIRCSTFQNYLHFNSVQLPCFNRAGAGCTNQTDWSCTQMPSQDEVAHTPSQDNYWWRPVKSNDKIVHLSNIWISRLLQGGAELIINVIVSRIAINSSHHQSELSFVQKLFSMGSHTLKIHLISNSEILMFKLSIFKQA